ncbi:GNAT family N-acetyltransferase [Streptomyces sp. NPDC048361]|uniref:GNAT family N-acetyltransferase n=1 Tax=Streptomyces sp. NPDC048361 TaxID=3154720 RepID=UPI00343205A6
MTETLRVEATSTAAGLVLRPWRADDAEGVLEAYGDSGIARWTNPPIATREDALRWIDLQRQGQDSGVRLAFAVVEDQPGLEGGKLLGNIVVKWEKYPGGGGGGVDSARGVDSVGEVGSAGEVGYWTLPHARGRGVAPRSLEALSTWVFDTFAAQGLRRLELIHQVDNLASCRVAEKCGYRLDRILPATPPYPRDGHLHVREAGN